MSAAAVLPGTEHLVILEDITWETTEDRPRSIRRVREWARTAAPPTRS